MTVEIKTFQSGGGGSFLMWFALATIAAVTSIACNPQVNSLTQRLSIATGGTGGVYYPYGGGLAKLISDHLVGVGRSTDVQEVRWRAAVVLDEVHSGHRQTRAVHAAPDVAVELHVGKTRLARLGLGRRFG